MSSWDIISFGPFDSVAVKMKVVCWCFLVLTFLLVLTEGTCPKGKVYSIASGTSFGFCRGYCLRSINVTKNPLELSASKEPNFAQVEYPPVQKKFPFNSTQWQDLLAQLNLATFKALDDRIGCPDCADGGAEWIQVDWSKGSKRVTFENGQLVQGIEGLIGKLRQIREQYLTNL